MLGGRSAPLLNGNSLLQRWPTNRGRRPGPSVLFWQSASPEDRAPTTLTLALSHRMGEGGGLRDGRGRSPTPCRKTPPPPAERCSRLRSRCPFRAGRSL